MKRTIRLNYLSHEFALKLAEQAVTKGQARNVAVSVAIVNPSLELVAFVKADGATAHSVETSRRKANTAASTKKPSGWMSGELATSLPLASGNLLTNILGGLPIEVNGEVGGGLGIAGGTPEQDAEIAKTTLELLKD